MIYPSSLKKLIESFKDLPGIGEKSAERLAFYMLSFSKDKLSNFSDAIVAVRDNIRKCSVCNNISEEEICSVCKSDVRDHNVIFVVETAKDVSLFEKLGIYKGVYHVLNGLISPLSGVGPEDINIKTLIDRVNNNDVTEVILALKPSIEGETTSQYINKVLNNKVKVTKIASGIPMGADIEYIDPMTLEMAIDERKNLS